MIPAEVMDACVRNVRRAGALSVPMEFRMKHPFDYVAPSPENLALMKDLSVMFQILYEKMEENILASAERTLAIRRLQESRMWANVAILGVGID